MSKSTDRRHERHELDHNVHLRVDHWSGLHARCQNISYGGIALVLPHAVNAGDKLVFNLALPEVGKVTLEGEIRHVTELSDGRFAVGLQWHLPTDVHHNVVRQFVDEQRIPTNQAA